MDWKTRQEKGKKVSLAGPPYVTLIIITVAILVHAYVTLIF